MWHVPGEKQNNPVAEGRPSVGKHVGNEWTGGVLGQEISPEKGLTEQCRNDPQIEDRLKLQRQPGERRQAVGQEVETRLENKLWNGRRGYIGPDLALPRVVDEYEDG